MNIVPACLAAIVLAVLAMVFPLPWPGEVERQRNRALLSFILSDLFATLAALFAPYGHGPTVPFFATVALVAWVLLGCLWLMRRYPGLEQPDWAMRPWSIADWGLIVIVGLAGSVAVWG